MSEPRDVDALDVATKGVSGRSSRRKGIKGEREVAAVYQSAGLDVRNLEGSGDHLIVCAGGLTLHSETKRHASRVRIPEWIRQTEAEAPQGTVPALHWRQDHGRWYVNLPLDDFATILAQAATAPWLYGGK